ncbi:hypothetical protein PPBDW_I10105 [Photobacterium kishitanii]|nr:hypothetical protein PPBDW_I10105 [Photobacterium kishitanii]
MIYAKGFITQLPVMLKHLLQGVSQNHTYINKKAPQSVMPLEAQTIL